MIITRTPLRASFMGGGSDIRDFYLKNGYGAVVSAAIKKYMYIVIHPYFHDKIRIKYSKTEDVEDIDAIRHPIVRECLKRVKIERGIEIASFADIPSGTGLGSSSAFTVGLLSALYTYKGILATKERLAREACEIEIDILREPIGKQDQYAVAFGNVNYIRFNNDESVNVNPICLTDSIRKRLENNLHLYYVGGNRRSGDILSEQKKNLAQDDKFEKLKKIVALADEMQNLMYKRKIDEIGVFLHKGWLYKKKLASGISNGLVDSVYSKALENGALGGKLLGAGGNGFLLIYSKNHKDLKTKFDCRVLPFELDKEGTKVIFYE